MNGSYVDVACDRAGVTREEWEDLVRRSGNVFATRLWLDTWYRHLGFGHEVVAAAARDEDGRLIGLLPMVAVRRHPRVLLPAVLWPPPAGPIVSTPADFAQAARLLADQLASRGDWDVLMAAALPVDAGWRDQLRAFSRGREHNRVIALDGMDWEQWLASRSRNFRKQTRKRDERLAARFEVRYRRTTDPARLDADLGLLFDLHDRRYGLGSTGLSHDRESGVQAAAGHRRSSRGDARPVRWAGRRRGARGHGGDVARRVGAGDPRRHALAALRSGYHRYPPGPPTPERS
jgi:hypothetical protein